MLKIGQKVRILSLEELIVKGKSKNSCLINFYGDSYLRVLKDHLLFEILGQKGVITLVMVDTTRGVNTFLYQVLDYWWHEEEIEYISITKMLKELL